ncbi:MULTISPECIES: HNH endonuclease [Xanthomonas]|uniref:AP2/ERF domain-containing protein n=1 Tax=Xanthomonas campestris pv. phaseoli TaxID=317013 RepID=A0A7Z7NHB6_XANCH|nr:MULTISPECIES: HNH endonuclease [Xanthomonas]ATS39245.2 HNH endonuclease [Xanthomonas citri pv. phaseoli var. fuscans]ATS41949.2 HNH endonuclease [Xanthomonas citri pv. phaseoli var. fuscans]ATS47248.2 HNH endonuclease [Xanthomonas citri pv. phaseoli var. fuscans]ATS86374.2 HNH endonuclease [Xanthomonas citri pv. phaseoli var. fuscans]UZA97988.1 HNH endonuclease [Xanthomonas citri pv. fuscans]
MPPKPLPPLADLAEVISYDPDTGVFTNRVTRNNCAKAGAVTGCRNQHTGYVVIRFRRQLYLAHRLAWLFVHGVDPGELDVDHINGNQGDNRISNLRLATRRQNLLNSKRAVTNTTGFKGVVRRKCGKFMGCIRTECGFRYTKSFDTAEEAAVAYRAISKQVAGEFARAN